MAIPQLVSHPRMTCGFFAYDLWYLVVVLETLPPEKKYFCEDILKMCVVFFFAKFAKKVNHTPTPEKRGQNCLFSAQTKRCRSITLGFSEIFPSQFGNTDDPRIWVNSTKITSFCLDSSERNYLPLIFLTTKGRGLPTHGALVSDSKKNKTTFT